MRNPTKKRKVKIYYSKTTNVLHSVLGSVGLQNFNTDEGQTVLS
jgi:hypothetical protein